eukprot:scaffold374_cov271-Pinguiococcus_pyrenoidosus.AAC.13
MPSGTRRMPRRCRCKMQPDSRLSLLSASDIVRYELLYRFGGVYVDVDFVPLQPLDGFLQRVPVSAVASWQSWRKGPWLLTDVVSNPCAECRCRSWAGKRGGAGGPQWIHRRATPTSVDVQGDIQNPSARSAHCSQLLFLCLPRRPHAADFATDWRAALTSVFAAFLPPFLPPFLGWKPNARTNQHQRRDLVP